MQFDNKPKQKLYASVKRSEAKLIEYQTDAEGIKAKLLAEADGMKELLASCAQDVQ